MKNNFTITFVLSVLIGLHSASAQTPTTHTGDVSVVSQTEVDALSTSLTAGATRIMGNVTIGPATGTSDISDLSPLVAITEITGNVLVQNNSGLTNLMGLNQLQTIDGFFSVSNNATLTSLGNFTEVQTIGGSFEVFENADLTSLGDFSTLETIGGSFYMSNNNELISLGAFPMLARIGSTDGIYIPSTDSRQDGVSIVVEDNDRLQDCCVLTEFLSGAANAVSGQIFIGDNAPGCSSTMEVNCDPFLQVGQRVVFIAKTATEGTLEIFSRGRWQLSKPNTGAEWITNIAASGGNSDASSITGENDASITITTTANPNDAGRSTILTLTAMDMDNNALTDPAPITISFTQLGTTRMGDVFVTTQAEVNALAFPANAMAIQGNVTIGPESGTSDITDLSPLAAITEITGNVRVQRNPLLPNLMELNQLQTIGGSFEVFSNVALTSLGDFSTLQSIGDYFYVSNEDLISLGDFSTLQSIGGFFNVRDNAVLTSLGDFSTLQSIGSSFSVFSNDELTSMGNFSTLQTIGSFFQVFSNDELTSMGNFSTLQTIGDSFLAFSNVALTSLGNFSTLQTIGGNFVVGFSDSDTGNATLTSLGDFTALQSIGGTFQVSNNAALTSLGDFTALQTIEGGFFVFSNVALTSLGNFSALQSIGGHFFVFSNAALTSLGDFTALQSIGSSFRVGNNIALTSLGGFPMLASIGTADGVYVPSTDSQQDGVSIVVERNNLLQDCCVLTEFLSGATSAVSGQVFINENATGCSSITEVNCDPFLQVGQKAVFVAKTATKGTLDIFSTLRWQLNKPNTGQERNGSPT